MNIYLYKNKLIIICLIIVLIFSSTISVVIGNHSNSLNNNKSINEGQNPNKSFFNNNQTIFGPTFNYKITLKNKESEIERSLRILKLTGHIKQKLGKASFIIRLKKNKSADISVKKILNIINGLSGIRLFMKA